MFAETMYEKSKKERKYKSYSKLLISVHWCEESDHSLKCA